MSQKASHKQYFISKTFYMHRFLDYFWKNLPKISKAVQRGMISFPPVISLFKDQLLGIIKTTSITRYSLQQFCSTDNQEPRSEVESKSLTKHRVWFELVIFQFECYVLNIFQIKV